MLTIFRHHFSEYIKECILEDVTNETYVTNSLYLPHRPILREDRWTTKIITVFDASVKYHNEKSLGDILDKGPCLLPYLFDILLRFRVGKIGSIGDIKQAFLQICTDKNDRNYSRLLWFDNVNDTAPKIKILCFTCLVFRLSSSPFILNSTVKVHLEKYLNDSTKQNCILKQLHDLYVDDTKSSFNDNEEAFSFYKIASYIMRDGNFQLRKWASNDKDLEDKIDKLEVNNKCIPVTENDLSFVQMEIRNIFKKNEPEYRKV